jgi:hypothetical protein
MNPLQNEIFCARSVTLRLSVNVEEKKVGWLALNEAGWLKGHWVGEPSGNG